MYQFIHADIYARTASTNAKSASKYNYKDILGEATRLPEHSQHVKNPKPPKFLLGDEDALAKMSERIEYNAANYKDKIGRKMRADAPVLLAGVVSFPQEVVEADPILYQKWASLNLEYLQNKYGDNLRAVVEHTDEEYPHLHFYVQSDTEVNAKMIHDGYKAGKDYKRACQKWQDEYYEAVAVKCGMARLGPKRRRLNRAEWHAEKERNMTLVNAERAVNEVLNNAMVREKDAALKSRENDDIACFNK